MFVTIILCIVFLPTIVSSFKYYEHLDLNQIKKLEGNSLYLISLTSLKDSFDTVVKKSETNLCFQKAIEKLVVNCKNMNDIAQSRVIPPLIPLLYIL